MRDLGDAIKLTSLEGKLIELVVPVNHEDTLCWWLDARVSTIGRVDVCPGAVSYTHLTLPTSDLV